MTTAPSDRLDSWKEIAAYLNRGVRTVRRWEVEEGLPVHRHIHRALGSVYAFKSEIDAWRTAARGTALPVSKMAEGPSPTKSIAVLPFVNLTSDPETEYFADGLTDEVIADLSKVRTLRVISRTSSATFKGSGKDAKTIARDLGVRYIVEGTVRRSERRFRMSARLIEGSTDAHVWGDKYEGTIDDVFTIQERLARLIVEALELRLTADEERRLAERPVASVPAYECYLRARHEGWRWRKDSIDRAVHILRDGLSIAGEDAGLYAALGLAYLQYREAGIDLGDGPLGEADACVRRVVALDPRSALGPRLRGWIHYARGSIQEAVNELKAALDLDRNNADTLLLLTNCYLISGHVSVARPLIDRLLSVDPLTPLTRCLPGWADLLEGNLEAAIEPYRQMFEMDPENPMGRLFYVYVLTVNHRSDAVRSIVEGFPSGLEDTVAARVARFLAHAVSGNLPAARALVSDEVEAVATAAADVFPRLLAHGFALAGDHEQAMRWLSTAIDRGFINYPFLARHDPCLGPLRSDPGFQQLLETVRERWESFAP